MKHDPLAYFLEKIGYQSSHINYFNAGDKYAVIRLNDGNVGVCGIHEQLNSTEIPENSKLDLNLLSHRILYTCYLNASLNHRFKNLKTSSFVETIQPGQFSTIVMIGLFRPLLDRLSQVDIHPVVFDFNKDEPGLTPMEDQNMWLSKADLVILSATTIPNGTFAEIINHTNKEALVVLTGPTSILHNDLFQYLKKGIISGMIFPKNQSELIESILAGNGTRQFKQYGRKVDLFPDFKSRS